VEVIRLTTSISQPTTSTNIVSKAAQTFNQTGLSLGQRVLHAKFGEGIIINYEGSDAQARVEVGFDDGNTKWLMVAYARLEVIG